jgi:hypothetical protein
MTAFDLAVRLLHRSRSGDLAVKPIAISVQHRRALAVQTDQYAWLSIKGIGWVHGPPWAVLSPKDAELCFGIMDGESARREVQVSNWLRDRKCDVTICLEAVLLSEDDLALIGVHELPRFRNGRLIEPAVLFTQCRSALRVSDWTPRRSAQWQSELQHFFGSDHAAIDKKSLVIAFARHLAGTIRQYHALGAVNDTLAADNVTIAGEITDFEWFYVPEIPLPDGTTDIRLSERQAKEAIYLIDVLLSLTEGLSLEMAIAELAMAALPLYSVEEGATPFDRQLQELCRI